MTGITIEVLPQPRIDTLVTDAATGAQRRRTEYAGTVWFGGRPQATGGGPVAAEQPVVIDTPMFLPDSLPYRPDRLDDARIACSIAIQGSEGEGHQVLDHGAGPVADPRNAAVSWMQLRVTARARTPLGVSYRGVALVAVDAVHEAQPAT
jgi:hypothetical protein